MARKRMVVARVNPKKTTYKKYQKKTWAPNRYQMNIRSMGFRGLELKYRDTFYGLQPVATSWAPIDPTVEGHLVPVGQGSTPDQRDGTKLTVKSLFIRGQIRWLGQDDQTSVDHPGACKIVVFLDTQTNKAAPTVSGGEDSGALFISSSTTSDIMGFRGLAGTDRYKVLQTKIVQPNVGGGVGGSGTADEFSSNGVYRTWEIDLPNLNIPMRFNSGASGNIGDVLDNSLHICACRGGDRGVHIEYQARVRFLP